MAGSLIKIDEEIVTSAVASVSLLGIDSTYDVYMVKGNNINLDTDGSLLFIRTAIDGTEQTTANYDKAAKLLKADTTFGNIAVVNDTFWYLDMILGTGTQEQGNFVSYLFNWNNSSEYSFITNESSFINSSAVLQGYQGGGVYTVAEAHNSMKIYANSGNIASGKFTLYGLKKW